MKNVERKKQITIRLSVSQIERLDALAESETRDRTNMIEALIDRYAPEIKRKENVHE